MTRIRSRLEQLEKHAAPIIKAQNTIRLYAVADHPGLELVTFDDFPALGVVPGDMERIDDPAIEWDMGQLTSDQLETIFGCPGWDDLPINVQHEMIAYIRDGRLDFAVLVDEFNEAIATEAFNPHSARAKRVF